MRRVIYLPTIQHTGTWFVMELLRKHPEVDACIESHLLKTVSLSGAPYIQMLHKEEGFSKKGITILQQHIPLWEKTTGLTSPGQSADSLLFAGMVCVCHTVLPLRDPLLSCITALNRRTKSNLDLNILFLVHIWAQVVRDFQALNEVAKPCYFPVDVLAASPITVRKHAILNLMRHCGLVTDGVFTDDKELMDTVITTLAVEWPVVRAVQGKFETKEKYYEGDADYFKKEMPKVWKELRKAEPLLRPFLELFGYRNLMWWSDYV